MAEAPLLRLAGISKRFKGALRGAPPVEALRDVSLVLGPGRRLGLVGPDAGGKTTLMRILAGLVEADDGTVELLGGPPEQLDRSQVGYMPQSGALYAELTVAQNLELYARLRGVEPLEDPARMEHLYGLTGLAAFRDRAVGKLSGGMRQKLALACAVVARPRLMLLDEPSVGVDPVSRQEIWQLAMDLSSPQTSLVWTTNILEDAARCDEIVLLHEGAIRYHGPPVGLAAGARDRCFSQPLPSGVRRKALQDLLLDPGVISGRIEGGELHALTRQPEPPQGGKWKAVPARPDEGFAAMLDDGAPLLPSALAEAFPFRFDQPDQPTIAAIGLAIEQREVLGGLILPPDLSARIARGEAGQVGLLLDGRRVNASQILTAYFSDITGTVGMALRPAGAPPAVLARNWYNPNLDYSWFTLPGMVAVITTVLVLSVSVQAIARERDFGTYDQLMALPMRHWEIVAGKAVPAFLVGLFNGSFYVAMVAWLSDVPFNGSYPAIVAAIAAFSLAVTAIGLAISSVAGSQQQAFLGGFLVIVPMILLSGYASPVDGMPAWLQPVAAADPLSHLLAVCHGIFLKDLPIGMVSAHILPMLAVAVLALLAATGLLRRRSN